MVAAGAARGAGQIVSLTTAVLLAVRPALAQTEAEVMALPPVTVEAEAAEERGDGPVGGYRASRSTTATKTDTPIMETPASISTVPRELVRDLNAQTAGGALQAIPSLAQRQNYQGYEAFTIRGLFVDNETGYQIDGMRTRNVLQFDPALFERIEVLKGPASLLYGSMEPGGVINFVTLRPTAEPFVSGGFEVGTYDDLRATLDGSYRFANGVAVRLPVAARRYDTFRDHVDDNKSLGLLPTVEVPLGERTSARLTVGYFDQALVDDTILIPLVDGEPADIAKDTFLGIPDATQQDSLLQTLAQVDHAFTDGLTWRNTFSFFRTESNQDTVANVFGVDANGETFSPLRVKGDSDVNSFQHQSELFARARFLGMRHEGLLGVDLQRNVNDETNNGDLLVSENIFDPRNDPTVAIPDFVFDDLKSEWTTDSLGVYGQDQITLLENRTAIHRLIAVVGGRWDAFRQRTDTTGEFFGSPPADDSDIDKSKFSPRLGLVWMPVERLSLYGSWSRSFAPQFIGNLATTPPDPQEAEQFEVGVKVEPLERAQVTLSLFDITKENVPGPSLNGVTTELIGKERSRGFEVDFSGELLPGWQVFGGYAYTNATIDENTDGTEGNDLFNAPRHRFTLWSGYTQPTGPMEGLGGGAGVFYTGDSYADNANDVKLDAFTLVDAALWHRPSRRYFNVSPALQIGVRNLLDENYYLGGNGFNSVEPGAPRTFYASLQLTF